MCIRELHEDCFKNHLRIASENLGEDNISHGPPSRIVGQETLELELVIKLYLVTNKKRDKLPFFIRAREGKPVHFKQCIFPLCLY